MNYINKTAVKRLTLETLKEMRPHLVEKMTRISAQWYDSIDRNVAMYVRQKIEELNTAGKTIK